MNCFRCASARELSVRARNKSGHTRYMCRTCRRAEYHAKKHVWALGETYTPSDEWNLRAMDSYIRIVKLHSRIEAC